MCNPETVGEHNFSERLYDKRVQQIVSSYPRSTRGFDPSTAVKYLFIILWDFDYFYKNYLIENRNMRK